ncbi:MAG: hypothetical protein ACLU9S_03920 [Oscillospiraceae bacterium]|uniref:hypothetical protein n=1 Tax=Allofournierella sp. TaxID=1940256 RepID=UPI0039C65018
MWFWKVWRYVPALRSRKRKFFNRKSFKPFFVWIHVLCVVSVFLMIRFMPIGLQWSPGCAPAN